MNEYLGGTKSFQTYLAHNRLSPLGLNQSYASWTLIIQSLAANLGVSTGKYLAEHCKAEYPIFVKLCLWILAELVVITADIPEELSYVKPPAKEVMKGMFVPKLKGQGATGDAIALLGALVMPHNLFLHSALVLSRKIPNSVRGINMISQVKTKIAVAT
ncbi:hypothetical protein SASPL_145258 [Salvia splendens]|uniref:Manganese transport protein n=1 Tax=Salvia splendens TaxID=180675 RepID=A0A8X8WHW1_SALSN|nr:hypothetical protein SASPL_145258 [Salvia splendens]